MSEAGKKGKPMCHDDTTRESDTADETMGHGFWLFVLSVLCSTLATGSLLTLGGSLAVRVLFHIRIIRNTMTAVEATVLPLLLMAGILWLAGLFVGWIAHMKKRRDDARPTRIYENT